MRRILWHTVLPPSRQTSFSSTTAAAEQIPFIAVSNHTIHLLFTTRFPPHVKRNSNGANSQTRDNNTNRFNIITSACQMQIRPFTWEIVITSSIYFLSLVTYRRHCNEFGPLHRQGREYVAREVLFAKSTCSQISLECWSAED
ncbi:hypothetical protein CDAR_539441 [Caerostris darwini]|uniref:Uncharacterized protein n=1 Tax=Caerostris darwini TaxID=1538125 RepID=A0AAV4WHR6_9ARAC|nr:hypothetical protein CDAR_539441 [Caerostris darwini]